MSWILLLYIMRLNIMKTVTKNIFYYENRKIKEKGNYKGWTFNARIDQKAEFVSGYTDYLLTPDTNFKVNVTNTKMVPPATKGAVERDGVLTDLVVVSPGIISMVSILSNDSPKTRTLLLPAPSPSTWIFLGILSFNDQTVINGHRYIHRSR